MFVQYEYVLKAQTQKNKEHVLRQTDGETDRQTERKKRKTERESKWGEMEHSTSIIRMIIMAVVMATSSHPPLPPLLTLPLFVFLSQINSNSLKCHGWHSKDTVNVEEYEKT